MFGRSKPEGDLRVAIIGGASREKFFLEQEYDQASGTPWEIWGLNAIRPAWQNLGWARMFNLHRFAHLNRDAHGYIYADSDWAKDHPEVPVYVIDDWHGLLPNQRIFPLSPYPGLPRYGLYHAGSFDMMVAFAIIEGAVEIVLHGIGLALDSWQAEPISARACLEYWCGVAEGRGIKVRTTPDCNIFRQYHLVVSDTVYGRDDVKLIMESRDLGRPLEELKPLPERGMAK